MLNIKKSKNRIIKESLVEQFSQKIQNKSFIIINNKCITSNIMNQLRKEARSNNIEVLVYKNSLVSIASNNNKYNSEFVESIKTNNIFLICDDVIDGLGITSVFLPNTFNILGYHDNKNNFSLDESLMKSLVSYKNVKNVISSNLGLIQEPLMQLKLLFELIAQKSEQ